MHILVFSAERAWAFAIHMKKQNEKSLSLQRRGHLIRRLRKAHRWASEIVRLGADSLDVRSRLEADCYEALMHGSLLLEEEKHWQLALAKFLKAK